MQDIAENETELQFLVTIKKSLLGRNPHKNVSLIFLNRKKETAFSKIGFVKDSDSESFLYSFTINKKELVLEEKKKNYHLYIKIGNKTADVRIKKEKHQEISNTFFETPDFLLKLRYDRHGRIFYRASYKQEAKELYDIPNEIENILYENNEVIFEGTIWNGFLQDNFPNASYHLLLKKRKGTYILKAPMNIYENKFTATLQLADYSFLPQDRWDTYILLKDEDFECSFPCYVNQPKGQQPFADSFQISWHREAIRFVPYSVNGKLFTKTTNIKIVPKEVTLSYGSDTVTFKAEFDMETFKAGLKEKENLYLRFRQRDSNEYRSFPIHASLSEEKVILEASLNYDDLNFDFTENVKRWDVYLSKKCAGQFFNYRIKINSINSSQDLVNRTFFNETDYYYCMFYLTKNKRMSFVYSKVPFKKHIDKVVLADKKLSIYGSTYFSNNIEGASNHYQLSIMLLNRLSEESKEFPVQILSGSDSPQKQFRVDIPTDQLGGLVPNFKEILDFYILLNQDVVNRKLKIGLKEFTYFKDAVLETFSSETKNEMIEYHLTTTPKGNLKLESFRYSKESYKEIKYFSDKKTEDDIWLVGERPDTAQDNGYHFFRYLRKTLPDKEIYYVIDPNSLDKERLIDDSDHVLYIGSEKHIQKSLRASKLIGTHDLEYFLPFKGIQIKNYREATKVFLQHGVLGRKNVEYHKKFYKYPFDLFIVSSKHEKKLVKKKLGYSNNEVVVTGLARFDELQKDHSPKREILLIPTWREWINNEEKLLKSLYFKKYITFLQSEELSRILEQYNLTLNFYPHYRMQQYIIENVQLNSSRINLVKLGAKTVQHLLKENSLMITDYSSVSFDFTLLGKPVIYYHFDQDLFFSNGILRPIEETFLGDIVYTQNELLKKIEEIVKGNFKEKREVTSRKKLIFTYQDTENNLRILNHILQDPSVERQNDIQPS
ncbi:CDP-glycerol glycerophosphotransferase family protein [Bacillus massiliglaciei]|uniref:CDP-glycerol glycerophosphotransferase family protein n=1 Tax=Bacillus massiliglaciei TaxID=1816693 RepID=UPI000B0A888B|nr:CDP-glycerol glycerophosphotransferase family protein [Bacillus massiliglaciei]